MGCVGFFFSFSCAFAVGLVFVVRGGVLFWLLVCGLCFVVFRGMVSWWMVFFDFCCVNSGVCWLFWCVDGCVGSFFVGLFSFCVFVFCACCFSVFVGALCGFLFLRGFFCGGVLVLFGVGFCFWFFRVVLLYLVLFFVCLVGAFWVVCVFDFFAYCLGCVVVLCGSCFGECVVVMGFVLVFVGVVVGCVCIYFLFVFLFFGVVVGVFVCFVFVVFLVFFFCLLWVRIVLWVFVGCGFLCWWCGVGFVFLGWVL